MCKHTLLSGFTHFYEICDKISHSAYVSVKKQDLIILEVYYLIGGFKYQKKLIFGDIKDGYRLEAWPWYAII